MANGSSASTAAKRAKEVGLPLGLHLNLTEGTPLTASTSLVAAAAATAAATASSGGDGARLMRGKFGFRKALEEGTVTVSDVAREIEAQLSWFEGVVGRQPHHVDGHQHVHVLPKVAPLLAKVSIIVYVCVYVSQPSLLCSCPHYTTQLCMLCRRCKVAP